MWVGSMTLEYVTGRSIVKLKAMCKQDFFFLSCITKMSQTFMIFFSSVDLHNIYYIVKMINQIWWFFEDKTYGF